METSTASRMLSIRLQRFMDLGFQISSDRAQSPSTNSLSCSLHCQTLSHTPSQCQLFFLNPFSNCNDILAYPVKQTYPESVLGSVQLFQSPESSTDPVSHHILSPLLPWSLNLHPNFTASSIPTLLCSYLVLSLFSLS